MKHLSLRARLFLAFAILSVFCGSIGAWNAHILGSVSETTQHIVGINLRNIVWANEMRDASGLLRSNLNFLASPRSKEEDKKKAIITAKAMISRYEAADDKYNDVPFTEDEKAIYDPLVADWKTAKAAAGKALEMAENGAGTSDDKFAVLITVECRVLFRKLGDDLALLVAYHKNEADEWSVRAQSDMASGRILSFVAAAFGVLISLAIGWFFSNYMNGLLSRMAKGLRSEADQVADAARTIASAGMALSSSSTQQAAALQQTVSSIDEISAMVQKNSENAKTSQEVAKSSRTEAEQGREVLQEMINSIEAINRSSSEASAQVEHGNRQIEEIVKVINEIGGKTKVINDIVFQTKLLSFNASVEAARAGEHGKGFAVVAEEVGNLAQMSGNAAVEIGKMLEGSIQKVESIVSETQSRVDGLMKISREKVEAGTVIARRCGEVFERLAKSVDDVTVRVGEIAVASQEQSQGVGEINRAMAELDQVTQQNATSSQQSAVAAEQLRNRAERLWGIVSELEVMVHGVQESAMEEVPTPRPALKAVPMAKAAPALKAVPATSALPSSKFGSAVKAVPSLKTASAANALPSSKTLSAVKAVPSAKKAVKKAAGVPKTAKVIELRKKPGADKVPSKNDPRFEEV